MSKLVLLRGLPGAGKTTWAREWVALDPSKRIRLCRGEMRHMLKHRNHMDIEYEKIISKGINAMVRLALYKGMDVCLDDTNLNPNVLEKWQTYCHDRGYELQVKSFNTSPQECILRNRKRKDPTPPDSVVLKMYDRYVRNINALDGNILDERMMEW